MIIGNFTFDKKKNTYTGDIVTLSFEKRGVAFIPTDREERRERTGLPGHRSHRSRAR